MTDKEIAEKLLQKHTNTFFGNSQLKDEILQAMLDLLNTYKHDNHRHSYGSSPR